jgi:putative transcriptional regulator
MTGVSELAPGFLIAAPPLGDPNFERSVVLLASHDADGAFGWVLGGRRLMSLAELLVRADAVPLPRGAREAAALAELPGEVRVGGPVAQGEVWLVYPLEERLEGVEGQLEVAPGIAATAGRPFLERLAAGVRVPRLRGFAGYAGWGPGQLESEIQRGAWLPAPCRPELVFDDDPDGLWQRAFESIGTTPMAFAARTVGSA